MTTIKQNPDAFQWAYERHIANDPKEVSLYREEKRKADIGQEIYDLRMEYDISEQQLGELIEAPANVIHKLEAADYEGAYEELFIKIKDALRRTRETQAAQSGDGGPSEIAAVNAAAATTQP